MVNILLGILKVIGILLAVAVGLILLIIMIVLLGPICYRASGIYREDKAVSACVSWLGFVLRANADYQEKAGLLWGVRLFGILIASNDEEFIRKKEEKRRRKEAAEQVNSNVPEKPIEPETPVEPVKPTESEKPIDSVRPAEPEKPVETVTPAEQAQSTESETPAEPEKPKKKLSVTIKEKVTLIQSKIKQLIQTIKSIPDKIRRLIEGIKIKIENIKAKISRIMEFKEFFLGERHREAFLHIWKNVKKMICHILPRKLEGRVEFGVEDPYVMGQILTVLGIFYPVYQDKFTVIPDFENPGFAGDVSLKGRIIPGYLVLRMLIAVCSRKVIRLIKEGIQLIGGNKA